MYLIIDALHVTAPPKHRPTHRTSMAVDSNGVEALPGESEADYVARQARLKEEAAARMRAKFGASGGLNGGVRMGGIGSNASSGGSGGSGAELLSSLGSSASAGLGALASTSSWLVGSAAEKAVAVYSTVTDKAATLASQRAGDSATTSVGKGFDVSSSDISDLLGSSHIDDARPPARAPSTPSRPLPQPRQVVGDDFFNDTTWESSSAARTAAPAVLPTTPAPALVSTHHVATPSGVVGRKKVAANKVSDSSWDDWGDDKW